MAEADISIDFEEFSIIVFLSNYVIGSARRPTNGNGGALIVGRPWGK
jgi:hypothetical protein